MVQFKLQQDSKTEYTIRIRIDPRSALLFGVVLKRGSQLLAVYMAALFLLQTIVQVDVEFMMINISLDDCIFRPVTSITGAITLTWTRYINKEDTTRNHRCQQRV